MNSRRWQDHFQEAAQAAELTPPPTPGMSPLVAVLKGNILPEKDYLAWAQETFSLPILKSAFFTDHAFDSAFWQKWQPQHAWQVDCLPLCEWDGTLYVACLEPHEFAPEMNVVCLLTSLADLETRWAQHQGPSEEDLQLQDEFAETKTAIKKTRAPEDFEAPAGIVDLKNPPPPPRPDSVSFDSLELEASEDSAPEGLEVLSTDTVLPPAPVEPSLVFEKTVRKKAMPEESDWKLAAPVEDKIPAPASPKTPVAPVLAKNAPSSNSVFFLESALKKDKDIAPAPLLEAMKAHFEKSLLLAVDTLERAAKPIAWDPAFEAPPVPSEINLTTPSIFRIVNSTQRPFHGPVVQNDVNDHFFAEWNNSRVPDHVTIVPVLVQEHVVGMIMGFGTVEAFNRPTLIFVEDLVHQLTSKLEAAGKKAA